MVAQDFIDEALDHVGRAVDGTAMPGRFTGRAEAVRQEMRVATACLLRAALCNLRDDLELVRQPELPFTPPQARSSSLRGTASPGGRDHTGSAEPECDGGEGLGQPHAQPRGRDTALAQRWPKATAAAQQPPARENASPVTSNGLLPKGFAKRHRREPPRQNGEELSAGFSGMAKDLQRGGGPACSD